MKYLICIAYLITIPLILKIFGMSFSINHILSMALGLLCIVLFVYYLCLILVSSILLIRATYKKDKVNKIVWKRKLIRGVCYFLLSWLLCFIVLNIVTILNPPMYPM